jgi:hypothetical protein
MGSVDPTGMKDINRASLLLIAVGMGFGSGPAFGADPFGFGPDAGSSTLQQQLAAIPVGGDSLVLSSGGSGSGGTQTGSHEADLSKYYDAFLIIAQNQQVDPNQDVAVTMPYDAMVYNVSIDSSDPLADESINTQEANADSTWKDPINYMHGGLTLTIMAHYS